MNVDQDEIDAILGSSGQNVEDEKGQRQSIDDIVSNTLEESTDSTANLTPAPAEKAGAATRTAIPDNSAIKLQEETDSEAKIRDAQKILFEVFSSIPEKKERSRLLNWANDAFIKSKFF